MNTLFSSDSALMRGLSTVADVMILNLLFIATSIPVVTLGASLTALNFTAMRIATGKCFSVTDDYFRSFRQNLRQGTIVALVLAGLIAVLAAWYVVLPGFSFGPLIDLLLLALWYVLAFYFAATALFVFPYLANFEGTTREVFRNARLMSWRHTLTTLVAMAVIALAVGVTVFYPAVTGYGILWLAIGFAGIAVVNGSLFARVFSRYAAQASPSTSDE